MAAMHQCHIVLCGYLAELCCMVMGLIVAVGF